MRIKFFLPKKRNNFVGRNKKMYVHENKYWPHFSYSLTNVGHQLGQVRSKQGQLLGYMSSLGFEMRGEASFDTVTLDVLKTSEIEGVFVHPEQVRSSLARKLGVLYTNQLPADRNVDGIVEMMLDATQNFDVPLTKERLLNWHRWLFPEATSGGLAIEVGQWRTDSTGPMQVVSGPMGKEKVHFQAPDAHRLDYEMDNFLAWFNAKDTLDQVLKAAIAHFWFVTIHPFDDGNGRIARAIADMQLAKADGIKQRFYSMSAQIRIDRKRYYDILEKSQRGNLDIDEWLEWFLECLDRAVDASKVLLKKTTDKAKFWQKHQQKTINERQRTMLNKFMGDFVGVLNTSKYAKMCKCSADTALRDLQDLVQKQMLLKDEAGGRSTNYVMNYEL